ncbi:hypothetical protein ACTHRH_16165 [Paenibacillus sp. SAFN-117]|uniref:hypothetical protein n=1 Tax=Paenibacillus sp. 32O-W TaxID=1695218 RepID=UPI001C9301FE|nr:hypothetical protein [Paenibacillus sp. 32O-W]
MSSPQEELVKVEKRPAIVQVFFMVLLEIGQRHAIVQVNSAILLEFRDFTVKDLHFCSSSSMLAQEH